MYSKILKYRHRGIENIVLSTVGIAVYRDSTSTIDVDSIYVIGVMVYFPIEYNKEFKSILENFVSVKRRTAMNIFLSGGENA